MTRQTQNPPRSGIGLLTSERIRQRKTHAARLSMASNTLLVLLKLLVGFWSGSVSILSEAVHSASDLMASGIAFLSVRVADAPADQEHPYGHGKIEGVSGLAEAVLIFAAALYIIYESAQKIHAPQTASGNALNLGLLLMAFSALLNAALSRYLRRIAIETDSLALRADANHIRTDVLTSIGVFIGLALARLTHQPLFDPLTALIVALLILFTAYRLMHESLSLLLDARLPPEEEHAIEDVLDSDTRVMGYHKLRTRKSGSQRHADVHVQIEDDSTLVEAHDLTEELEDRIRAALPAIFINIHIEPYHAEMQHQREAHGLEMKMKTESEEKNSS